MPSRGNNGLLLNSLRPTGGFSMDMPHATGAEPLITVQTGEDYPDIREAVRRVCSDFPQDYWREKDEAEAYPTEFIDALTRAGFLGALIPEGYGGGGGPPPARGGPFRKGGG